MQVTLPPRLYGCPDAWARERTAVFGRAWLFLGHEAEAAAPGDWIAADIAGRRLLAVRGKDGALRAFHNVCRHRAGPLAQGSSGHCEGELIYAYHGWRYALDGRLRAAGASIAVAGPGGGGRGLPVRGGGGGGGGPGIHPADGGVLRRDEPGVVGVYAKVAVAR